MEIWKVLGGTAAVVAAIAALTRFLVLHWLSRNLESYKQMLAHEKAREIEIIRAKNAEHLQQLKHELETALARTSTIHEREFDVLKDAWPRLNMSMGHVASIVNSFHQIPNLDGMSLDRFEFFINTSKLIEPDRKELLGLEAGKRNEFYHERVFQYALKDAQRASQRFNRIIHGNSIFIEPSIRALLVRIDDMMWSVLVKREVGRGIADHEMWSEAQDKLQKEITPLKAEIERLVQKRLGYD